ncbi:DUF4180 domain-containing protein [Deinococcus psychrotolerans]|uniref:DUF4180 domain-containing protein n=1 Tax=Deinococcus psychrotolerans TaxID=2489213 RepID=A0A3G8YKB3_9DEIO|nr:DUF4180 domain-containing protein [Deinococcus psychrotolerans]AZI41941.1 DUF4180 domain-containing protein [Deinococcus psychrotolerans]
MDSAVCHDGPPIVEAYLHLRKTGPLSDGLILSEAELGDEFFRLSSGLAGELFQKFVNYRLPVALVLPDFSAHGERFAELAYEHSRHSAVRFVTSQEEALEWLSRQVNS